MTNNTRITDKITKRIAKSKTPVSENPSSILSWRCRTQDASLLPALIFSFQKSSMDLQTKDKKAWWWLQRNRSIQKREPLPLAQHQQGHSGEGHGSVSSIARRSCCHSIWQVQQKATEWFSAAKRREPGGNAWIPCNGQCNSYCTDLFPIQSILTVNNASPSCHNTGSVEKTPYVEKSHTIVSSQQHSLCMLWRNSYLKHYYMRCVWNHEG